MNEVGDAFFLENSEEVGKGVGGTENSNRYIFTLITNDYQMETMIATMM